MQREPVVMVLGKGRWRWVYEFVMAGLAVLVAVLLLFPDVDDVRAANLVVWGIFVVDYVLRLGLSTDRRAFVRANIVDLIAIMPADFFRAFRVLRLARLVRLLRAASLLARLLRDVQGVASTNGLHWVLWIGLGSVLVGGTVSWLVEPEVDTFGDGLWWAIVTATTVGYGDISPETVGVRIVAAILMLFGIGTIGLLTGSVATYFLSDHGSDDPDVEHIRERLRDWSTLSVEERTRLAGMLDAAASAAREAPDVVSDGAARSG